VGKVRKSEPLKASVLDRLLGEGRPGEGGPGVFLQSLKEAVRRDLEDLLNTRRSCVSWPKELAELGHSLVHYGVQDFSGSSLGSPDEQDRFRQDVQNVIRRYEPRLSNVVVKRVRGTDPSERLLRFRIEAILKAEPNPVPVTFDSALQPLTATFEVMGEGD
jgi:type VI secretion system protein ImpF